MPKYLIKPVITEKSLKLSAQGVYTFMVNTSAKKREISSEVSQIYHVHVDDIKTIKMHGKVKRAGKKMITRKKSDWKKAVIRLKKGESIDAFQMGSDEKSK